MSVDQKKLITALVIFTLLFVYGFAFFFDNSSRGVSSGIESVPESSSAPSEEERTEEVEPVPPSVDTNVPTEDEEVLSEKKEISTEIEEQTKEVSLDFVEQYAAFDIDDPGAHIESAAPFMSERLYNELQESMPRPTLTRAKVEPHDLHVTEVANPDDAIMWNVVMQGEVFDSEGNAEYEEKWYLVTVEIIDEEPKVVGIRVNLPN